MQSFPSGHTGSAFAVGVFMSLYLNAKVKAHSDCVTSFWKQWLVLTPLFGALLIACGVWVDCVSSSFSNPPFLPSFPKLTRRIKSHHAHDVILSMIVGTICALFAYRAHFHSLFDYRNNHIPLPYHGSTRSFKQSDQATKEKPGSTERIAGEEKVVYGVNNSLPDRHLAVRWPIGVDEKRGV